MAGGMHDLARTIRHFQEYLESILTEDLLNNFNQALSSISEVVKNDKVLAVINQLNTL